MSWLFLVPIFEAKMRKSGFQLAFKRTIVARSLLSVLAAMTIAPSADTKRWCPRGYEDINDVCVIVPGHG